MKPLTFLGDSLKRLREFPESACHDAGYQLHLIQQGGQPADFKPMISIGRGVEELRVWEMNTKTTLTSETFFSVWDAIADTPEQAANLRARAELMQAIAEVVKAAGWKQEEAGRHCGITQPRMNDLLRGRVSRFSIDALINIAAAFGRRVHIELEPPDTDEVAA